MSARTLRMRLDRLLPRSARPSPPDEIDRRLAAMTTEQLLAAEARLTLAIASAEARAPTGVTLDEVIPP